MAQYQRISEPEFIITVHKVENFFTAGLRLSNASFEAGLAASRAIAEG